MENEVLYIEQLAVGEDHEYWIDGYIPVFCVSLQGRSGAYGERGIPFSSIPLCAFRKRE
jgi:hypothetical protein